MRDSICEVLRGVLCLPGGLQANNAILRHSPLTKTRHASNTWKTPLFEITPQCIVPQQGRRVGSNLQQINVSSTLTGQARKSNRALVNEPSNETQIKHAILISQNKGGRQQRQSNDQLICIAPQSVRTSPDRPPNRRHTNVKSISRSRRSTSS